MATSADPSLVSAIASPSRALAGSCLLPEAAGAASASSVWLPLSFARSGRAVLSSSASSVELPLSLACTVWAHGLGERCWLLGLFCRFSRYLPTTTDPTSARWTSPLQSVAGLLCCSRHLHPICACDRECAGGR
jgi:hypothetical protein